MSKQLDPKIADVLKEYGFGAESCWNCHGTWVVLHKSCEQIAAKAGIKYDAPQVLVADKDAAAILVTGHLGEASEWSIGEAVVGLNYKVKGNMAGYPFAMAEKRAKDRVILKLIGLHGLVYSEDEADEFKESRPDPQPEQPRKAPDKITPEQVKELQGKLDEKGWDIEAFCQFGKVSCLADITQDRYLNALAVIEDYRSS